ncbi:MAG TPA: FtsX-like permease family protein [Mycobacteriales bacterium]|nr:FtsX-like permease family protein [Mycobacteriales bacterium]
MTSLLLGVRLALRGSRGRVAVTGLALAFAVAFLLAVLGALPARQAKIDRLADRQPVSVGTMAAAGQRPVQPVVTISSLYSSWRGRSLSGHEVVDVKNGSILPPGVARLPRPGELVVSPDLAGALRGPHAAELAVRLPGKVVGEIGAAGLSGPRELFAYVGVSRPSPPYPGQEVLRFGYRADRADISPELRVAAQLGALGLLLPVLVLVATATRLSAGTRDRRLAAVRLVGGTPRQVALLAAGEALVVGVLGSALGLFVFRVLRPVAAGLVPVEGGVFAADLQPPSGQLVGVLLAVPVLSLLVSLLAMRRLVVDPLGVRRRSRRLTRAGWWRLVPLCAGLALLGAMWVRDNDLEGGDVALLLGGGALTVIGLAVVAPVVSRLAGLALVRFPGTASRLAGRRLLADPSATARTLTGTVLVVFVGIWLLAFLPIVKASSSSQASDLSAALPGSSVVVNLGSVLGPDAESALRALPGVRQAVSIRSAQLARPGIRSVDEATQPEDLAQVAVARCADLGAVFGRDVRCGTAAAFTLREHRGDVSGYTKVPPGRRVVLGSDGKPVGEVVVPASATEIDLGVDGWTFQAGTFLDPSLLPPAATKAFSSMLLVRTDGAPATTERVRNALFSQGVYGAQTLDEQLAQEDRVVLGYEKAARLGLVLAVLVGGVSLLVASVDAVRARRRDLASLAALGVPVGVLRRALLLEVLAPLAGCLGVAVASGAFAAAAYLSADTYYRDQVGLPWAAWGGATGFAALVVLAVTALTLPLARSAARAEHLRTE